MDELATRKLKNYYTVFQVFTSVVTITSLSLGAYFTYRLAPIFERLDSTSMQVQAIMEDRKSVPEWRQRTVILENNYINQEKKLDTIQTDIKDIRNYLLAK